MAKKVIKIEPVRQKVIQQLRPKKTSMRILQSQYGFRQTAHFLCCPSRVLQGIYRKTGRLGICRDFRG